MKKIRVVLPAYNEEKSLPALLKRLENCKVTDYALEILIVNDGSTDRTVKVVSALNTKNCSLVSLFPNKGLAGAVREGLEVSVKELSEEDIIITMDADNSHDPTYIVEMVEKINNGADIVIASRFQKGAKVIGLSLYRRALSLSAGFLFRIFKPIKNVRDYTCGYRAYRVGLIKNAIVHYNDKFIEQQGFACMVEILLKLQWSKPSVVEIPFTLQYNLKESASKMKVWKTVKQTFVVLFEN